MKKQDYPIINEEDESTLQITPDIEEEIAESERGDTVSMNEFKSMFAQWL